MSRQQKGAIAPAHRTDAPQTRLAIPLDAAAEGAAYVYDGSVEGLLSAIFAAAAAHDREADIIREGEVQVRLDQDVIPVQTNYAHARRIQRTLVCAHGSEAFENVYLAALSDGPDVPIIVQRFVMYALQVQNPCRCCAKKATCDRPCQMPHISSLLNDIGNPLVWQLQKTVRSVINERHRMLQFLRFEHRENDIWFARCNPDASVVPLLMRHFAGRFNTERFVIYDEVHGISGIYDGRDISYVKSDSVNIPPAGADEAEMQEAWRRYWHSITIAQRYNPELQRQFMPKRFWRNMTEMQDPLPNGWQSRRQAAMETGHGPTIAAAERPSHRMAG